MPYCGFVVIERPFYADDVAKSLLDESALWTVYNGHLELLDRQEPQVWSKVQEKKAEQLESLAKELKKSHEGGGGPLEESPRRRDRRATTLILEDELMLRKAQKLLASQREVGKSACGRAIAGGCALGRALAQLAWHGRLDSSFQYD